MLPAADCQASAAWVAAPPGPSRSSWASPPGRLLSRAEPCAAWAGRSSLAPWPAPPAAAQRGGGGAWAAPCRLCLAEQLRQGSQPGGPARAAQDAALIAGRAAGAFLPPPPPRLMMCLESDGSSGGGPPGCSGRLRVSADDEDEDDGGGGGGDRGGCCGRSGEVQTLSGAVHAPGGGAKSAAGAERSKAGAAPSLGRARVAAAGILSVGNVLNYLDRYTVAGEWARRKGAFPPSRPPPLFPLWASDFQSVSFVLLLARLDFNREYHWERGRPHFSPFQSHSPFLLSCGLFHFPLSLFFPEACPPPFISLHSIPPFSAPSLLFPLLWIPPPPTHPFLPISFAPFHLSSGRFRPFSSPSLPGDQPVCSHLLGLCRMLLLCCWK